MNFLELCQMAHRYISGGNQPPGTAPLDVENQQGELFSLVKSVQEAYVDIQSEQTNWLFMMKTGSLVLPTGSKTISRDFIRAHGKTMQDYQRIMPLLGDGARYILISGQAGFSAGSGVSPSIVTYVPYQQWRGFKDRPPIRSGMPSYFTIMPNDDLAFDAVPNMAYTLSFDYRIRPLKLLKNGDTPVWDEDFHSVVAWRAVNLWGGRQTDPSKFQFAAAEYQRVMGEMRSRYLPETVFSVGEFSGQSVMAS